MPESPADQSPKDWIRQTALKQRRGLTDRSVRSEAIAQRALAELANHNAPPLVYISVRDEVETTSILEHTLQQYGQAVVPYCLPGNQLGLFVLKEHTELQPGAFGILEPKESLRSQRVADAKSLTLAFIPGVAFDHSGNRIGYGKGYFDRLLSQLTPDCQRLGLAFDCQIFPEVPAQAHDVPMHRILTESQSIACMAGR